MRKKVAYVVFKGRTVGIFESWWPCWESVKDWPGAKFLGFYTYEDAVEAWERYEEAGEMPSNDQVRKLIKKQKRVANRLDHEDYKRVKDEVGRLPNTAAERAQWIASRMQKACPCGCGKPVLERRQDPIRPQRIVVRAFEGVASRRRLT